MLKSLYVLVNLAVILFINSFFSSVDIHHGFPESVNSGSQFNVEITIDKGEVDRYARLSFDLPNGFTVKAKDTQGGQFSFEDQRAVVHWYNLPYDEVLKVNLVVTVAPAIEGDFTINGSFRYIDNNQIQEKNIAPHKIKVEKVEGVSDLLASQRYKYKDISLKPIDCIRQKPYMNEDNEIVVNLLVSKGMLTSFGKIEEQIPRGYKAVASRTKNAIFQVSGRVVKFLWMELPREEADKMFIVSYRLIQTEDYPNQAFVIHGNFSYSQDERTQTIPINERNIDLEEFAAEQLELMELSKEEQLAELQGGAEKKVDILDDNDNFTGISGLATTENMEAIKQQGEKTFEETLTPEERQRYADIAARRAAGEDVGGLYASAADQAAAGQTPTAEGQAPTAAGQIAGEPQRPTVTAMAGGAAGISYKVQIAASHKLVKNNYFKQFNITEPVHIELHEGWHKYTVGNFKVYKEARDYRVKIWETTPIRDAFVCAYTSGSRITVQEALMIANQQWIK